MAREAVQAPRPRPHGSHRSASAGSRLTPRRVLVIVAVGAIVLAAILIGVSLAGSGGGKQASGSVTGAVATEALLGGIPQQGLSLGRLNAPVTLVEYGDLQCPICRAYTVATLPTLVRDYVRTGKVRLEFRGLAFLGADSETALKAVIAAGVQNKSWNMLDLLYRNQGEENSGWATESTLRAAAAAIPNLYVVRWLDDRGSSATQDAIPKMRAQAQNLMGSQIRTPTFEVGRTGGSLRYLPISSLDSSAFTPALDQLLAR